MNYWKPVSALLALAFSTSSHGALINIDIDSFSTSATVLNFEDLNNNGVLHSSYGQDLGITFSPNTRSFAYSLYDPALVSAAQNAGLGDRAATWGGNGNFGSGFTLSQAQTRVGFFISSNVAIEDTLIRAYSNGVELGSQIINVLENEIGFVGFQDVMGIDQIIIGDNTHCPAACIHQLDNIMFETTQVVPVPAAIWLFGSGLIGLLGFTRIRN